MERTRTKPGPCRDEAGNDREGADEEEMEAGDVLHKGGRFGDRRHLVYAHLPFDCCFFCAVEQELTALDCVSLQRWWLLLSFEASDFSGSGGMWKEPSSTPLRIPWTTHSASCPQDAPVLGVTIFFFTSFGRYRLPRRLFAPHLPHRTRRIRPLTTHHRRSFTMPTRSNCPDGLDLPGKSNTASNTISVARNSNS